MAGCLTQCALPRGDACGSGCLSDTRKRTTCLAKHRGGAGHARPSPDSPTPHLMRPAHSASTPMDWSTSRHSSVGTVSCTRPGCGCEVVHMRDGWAAGRVPGAAAVAGGGAPRDGRKSTAHARSPPPLPTPRRGRPRGACRERAHLVDRLVRAGVGVLNVAEPGRIAEGRSKARPARSTKASAASQPLPISTSTFSTSNHPPHPQIHTWTHTHTHTHTHTRTRTRTHTQSHLAGAKGRADGLQESHDLEV